MASHYIKHVVLFPMLIRLETCALGTSIFGISMTVGLSVIGLGTQPL